MIRENALLLAATALKLARLARGKDSVFAGRSAPEAQCNALMAAVREVDADARLVARGVPVVDAAPAPLPAIRQAGAIGPWATRAGEDGQRMREANRACH